MLNKLLKAFVLLSILTVVSHSLTAQTPGARAFNASNPSGFTKILFGGNTLYTNQPGDTGYVNRTNIIIPVNAEDVYDVIMQGFRWVAGGDDNVLYAQYVKVFIDLNRDSSFTAAGETVFNPGTARYAFTGTIAIPPLSSFSGGAGYYRIRFVTDYNYSNAIDIGTGSTAYGQAIDMTLKVGPKVPEITQTFPAAGTVLRLDSIYSHSSQKPKIVYNNKGLSLSGGLNLTYKIVGPLQRYAGVQPILTNIYVATKETDIGDTILVQNPVSGNLNTYTSTHARGLAARGYDASNPYSALNNGEIDLRTRLDSLSAGEYMVEANITVPSIPEYRQTFQDVFNIAFENDLEIYRIVSPKTTNEELYPFSIPVSAVVRNVGRNPVAGFRAIAKIYRETNLVYTSIRDWTSNPPTLPDLAMAGEITINFDIFAPSDPYHFGEYSIKFEVQFPAASEIVDDQPINNFMPRETEIEDNPYKFRIRNEIDARADSVFFSADDLYVGRPVYPKARFSNQGLSDISNAPATLTIRRLPSNQVVYTYPNYVIPDISTGRFLTIEFPNDFIPPGDGKYLACVSISAVADRISTNNDVCDTFEVKPALNGIYTIGTKFQHDTAMNRRNFLTMEKAIDTLFLKGISGPVQFILTDTLYNVGNLSAIGAPAIDLSSRIVGVSETNTITFKPLDELALTKERIVINLLTNSGIGILIGQTTTPKNTYAPVKILRESRKKLYANSAGYITFDGGENKAFKFTMNTPSSFRAAFYLTNGASDITIKNCVITDGINQAPSYLGSVPLTTYNTSLTQFVYESDNRGGTNTYSAGIVLRSQSPIDSVTQNNSYFLDTLVNKNNIISNNEISNFGFGIVSLGAGVLFKQGDNKLVEYMNTNNTYSKNEVFSVGRAGFFFGFERASDIVGNRIYNVNGAGANVCGGILLGGQRSSAFNGYNNLDLTVADNEMFNITAPMLAYGIKSEQSINTYPQTNETFPQVPENIKIYNNVVRDLTTTTPNSNRIGIHVYTERADANWYTTTGVPAPKNTTHFTRDDKVINNTIWLRNVGAPVNGVIAGIAINQAKGAEVYNNAIGITDNNPSAYFVAGLYWHGVMPQNGGLTSNRNAFWLDPAAVPNAVIARFVETDNNSVILEGGDQATEGEDYKELVQWQMWTGQDKNSSNKNFTNDFTTTGQKLRIKTNPLPTGSVLDDKGQRVLWITADIDGNPRGTAGVRYDIGASEFSGIKYLSDLEAMPILEPGRYRRGGAPFNDAEYIMTTAPINIVGRVRNNGTLTQTNTPTILKVYRKTATGYDSLILEKSLIVNFPPNETTDIDFKTSFVPHTYNDLRGEDTSYAVPVIFQSMGANVTPLYKFEVTVDPYYDQDNTNNIISKYLRFYIARSPQNIVVSAENSMYPITSTSFDITAGRLNADSLRMGLSYIDLKIDTTLDKNRRLSDLDSSRYDYDMFDRKGWEPKTVDYTMFRTMFWTDGSENPLSRYEIMDIEKFLLASNSPDKKNLIIGSQEMLRANWNTIDSIRNREFLTAYYSLIPPQKVGTTVPFNPITGNGSYSGKDVVGVAVGRDLTERIVATGYAADAAPLAGLVNVFTAGEGLARQAYYYKTHTASPTLDSTMGVATTTITRNVIALGVDWRHWANIRSVLEAIVDFVQNNDGKIIPVNLLSFEAIPVGNRVELNWATASEYNSDRFEVERKDVGELESANFERIATEKAAGLSNYYKEYGPIVDRNVRMNNSYVYRLKTIDKDGQWQYSDEVEVTLEGSSLNWLGSAVPNPAKDEAKFSYSLKESAYVEILLYDISGNLVSKLFEGNAATGVNEVKINCNNLSSGLYNYVLKVDGAIFNKQLQVVR
ncbi:MAG: T9SS type A sorting domain-containing protein [Ignavibacteria bacterium]|jgi:hypothetical protein|nr:T9SS type A sorting domain-containing protein [Ignavibacteria bacterium]